MLPTSESTKQTPSLRSQAFLQVMKRCQGNLEYRQKIVNMLFNTTVDEVNSDQDVDDIKPLRDERQQSLVEVILEEMRDSESQQREINMSIIEDSLREQTELQQNEETMFLKLPKLD